MSKESTLKVVHFSETPLGLLTRLSKISRVLLNFRLLSALERLNDLVKRVYQLNRCSRLLKSSFVNPEGRLLPRYLSTLMVSNRAATLVKFIELASNPKALAVFLKKGVQVSTIQLQSEICCLMFFSISLCSLGQTSINCESNFTAFMSCPSGKAYSCSEESFLQAYGGILYLAVALMRSCPDPRGQKPQRLERPLSMLRFRLSEQSQNEFLSKFLPMNIRLSMYSLRNSFPRFYCCLKPTGVISPQKF